jgi:hypothetical protein
MIERLLRRLGYIKVIPDDELVAEARRRMRESDERVDLLHAAWLKRRGTG